MSVMNPIEPSEGSTTIALADSLEEHFGRHFSARPAAIAVAPGRVNLIGEHTDYNGGYVLPLAINRVCGMAGRPSEGDQFVIRSVDRDEEVRFSHAELTPEARGDFGDYIRGVVAGFTDRGVKVPAFEAVISSDVPVGSGLSSSAALEMATATLIESLTDHELPLLDKALLCQRAEHDFVGVPCGLMDQYTSAFGADGRLVLLDCATNASELVPFADPTVELLVINSNVRHRLADGEYAVRRRQCEAAAKKLGALFLRDVEAEELDLTDTGLLAEEHRRARHVISENRRTRAAVDALKQGDWNTVGQHMYASHRSLRDDFEVSCSELDTIVEICESIGDAGGVFGARMTGGGFGGCGIALVRADQIGTVQDRVRRDYVERTEIQPTLFPVRPGPGARLLRTEATK
jgi:galactokinase